MNKETHIQKYFEQSLSEEQLLEFDLLLKNDKEFKTLIDDYSNMHLAFKANEAKELKTILTSFDNESETKSIKWFRKPIFYYAAAAVLIVSLTIPMFTNKTSTSLFEDYYDVYPNVEAPIVRNADKTDAYDAFSSYENADYGSAIKHFQEILNNQDNPNYRFYLAMSLLNFDKDNEALEELLKLKDIPEFKYFEETLWYRALLQLKAENDSEAIKALKKLDTTDSKFKYQERKLLLQKLQ